MLNELIICNNFSFLQVDRAIADYGVCIIIDASHAPSYFNRAGLFHMQGRSDLALLDLEKAITLDPSNTTYRSNRALVLRSQGSYLEAIHETVTVRAVEMNPGLRKELQAGNTLHLDSDLFTGTRIEEDPIVVAMTIDKEERTQMQLEAITDFLKTVKFFHAFRHQIDVLSKIASALELQTFSKGEVIFSEGQLGFHFFMVLEGEVSIVKTVIQDDADDDGGGGGGGVGSGGGNNNNNNNGKEMVQLVKLFRGHHFGETALEHKGIRTAGAVATSAVTRLLTLHVDDYQEVTQQFKSVLRVEACHVLTNCPVFADWDAAKIEELASYAEIQMFSANTEILNAGDHVKFLYIIKKGIVKLNKSIDKPSVHRISSLPKLKSTVGVGMEVPGLWVMEKNWRDRLETFDHQSNEVQVDFTVGVLGSGQVFGELSVLDPEIKCPVSAVSFTPVELYVFESERLKILGARFNSTTMNALNESMNLHNPPGEKIAYYFRSKYMWEKRKDNLLQSVHVDNKRNQQLHSTNHKYTNNNGKKTASPSSFH